MTHGILRLVSRAIRAILYISELDTGDIRATLHLRIQDPQDIHDTMFVHIASGGN